MSNASAKSAGRLYRIIDFSRAVEIFETESLYFAHPRTWDDPYETRVEHECSHALFAQCWSQLGTSDAMWRIYSPNHTGVRISTSTKKFKDAVAKGATELGYRVGSGPVKYQSLHNLNVEVKELVEALEHKFELRTAARILSLKREAFEHEAEWRSIVYCPDTDPANVPAGITLKISPHKLIDSILFDPRAPQQLVDSFKYYFEHKLEFKGRAERSVLYKSPQRIQLVES